MLSKNLAKRPSILVVEDEYLIADGLERALAAQDAEVIGPAGTVEEALEILQQHQDLSGALLDLNLHGQLSYEVADALLAYGVPFVFSTGYDNMVIPARFASIPCFMKPSNAREIAHVLLSLQAQPIAKSDE